MSRELLTQQVDEFVDSLNELASWFCRADAVLFTSELAVGSRDPAKLLATVENDDYIALTSGDSTILRLNAGWRLTGYSSSEWLKTQQSEFHIFRDASARAPIIRYEFDDAISSTLPAAHFHLHTEVEALNSIHNDELEACLKDLGRGSRRSRKRAKPEETGRLKVHALHFPLGGVRFRPCLEELLLMLMEEFGIEPICLSKKEVQDLLLQRVEDWRLKQTRAIVRDAPATAAQQLTRMGFQIIPPAGRKPIDNSDKLRRL